MAAKVIYKQGLKATYLSLLTKDPDALYFCTDTNELFRGENLYSDGIRFVGSVDDLPAFGSAADGIIYFCQDSGNGFVLSESRDEWTLVIHGVDNVTIGYNADGLMAVQSIPMDIVTGLVEKFAEIEKRPIFYPSDEFTVADDSTLSIRAIEQRKIIGLEERLSEIENAIVGGVHYRGAVDIYEDLPSEAAQGDLYEVKADNSEWCWNGEQWFEYGNTSEIDLSKYVAKDEVRTVAKLVDYEIAYKPYGTLVNYFNSEIRVMCPSDTIWSQQSVGTNGDPNMYYIGFKAYAPNESVMSFKEDLSEIISDQTMYYFDGNDFAGIDEYGRKYSIVWLPVAAYDESTQVWTYYGASSTTEKYIGWHYSVNWYDANGTRVGTDTIRINLTNEDCHTSVTPYYIASIKNTVESIEESYSWGDM